MNINLENSKLIAERTSGDSRSDKKIYLTDDGKLVKVFGENFKVSDILNEAVNQARVYEAGVAIPKLLEVELSDSVRALVSEYIPGKSLSQVFRETENDEERLELLKKFVGLQINLLNDSQGKAPLLTKLKDKMRRKIDETSFTATIKYELAVRLNSMPSHDKICHGDFCPSNIIVQPDGELRIIDWSHVTQGNAGADVARTFLLFTLQSDVYGEEFADKYLKLFCDKADIARQYIQRWIPIVAASQSVKGKPEEAELLKQWVGVVEYE